ncbi:MAG: hypothetical protein Q9219_007415 [cf. Caloplaca sp. 3 TL-2023]
MSKRPPRNAPAPAPAAGDRLYCHTCGRIITPRRPHTSLPSPSSSTTTPTPQKYCSDRCRREKPRRGRPGSSSSSSIEARIENVFVSLLDREGGGAAKGKVVECGEVERVIFGEVGGDGGARDGKGESEDDVVEEEEEERDGGGGVPLPADTDNKKSAPTGANEMTGTSAMDGRLRGMQRARNREMVRQAARRGVAFGFLVDGKEEGRRRAEAVQNGRVVESSFAKGEWGVRWRDGHG